LANINRISIPLDALTVNLVPFNLRELAQSAICVDLAHGWVQLLKLSVLLVKMAQSQLTLVARFLAHHALLVKLNT